MRFALAFATQLEIPVADEVHFIGLISDLLSACEERRFGQYEHQSCWEFAEAERPSTGFQKFLADGLTRSLVAAATSCCSSSRTSPGRRGQVDRVLNAPTSDVWIDPWLKELKRLGVDYRLLCRVDAIESRDERDPGVRIQP